MSAFPSRQMIPDRSSPSRVRSAASRPGPLRADPKGWRFTKGKGAARGGLAFGLRGVGEWANGHPE